MPKNLVGHCQIPIEGMIVELASYRLSANSFQFKLDVSIWVHDPTQGIYLIETLTPGFFNRNGLVNLPPPPICPPSW
jgi:hypothetical protein